MKIVLKYQIIHLGNYIDRSLTDSIDCTPTKIYRLRICQVNKLCANFGCLQMSVSVRLFKTYCCTFYRYKMWQVNNQSSKPNNVCRLIHLGIKVLDVF